MFDLHLLLFVSLASRQLLSALDDLPGSDQLTEVLLDLFFPFLVQKDLIFALIFGLTIHGFVLGKRSGVVFVIHFLD